MADPAFVCANWEPGSSTCKQTGTYSCKGCRLVIYCGPDCQKSHWSRHKVDCKDPLGKQTWQPSWVVENRMPAFIGGGGPVPFGVGKYLWGNVPAYDVLQLAANEGEDYKEDLHLLFAASGDLRNVVKTITQLPTSYDSSVEVTINDRDLDIVARNTMLLLVALVSDDADEAVDCMIHVWYSALLRKSDLEFLQMRVRPLVESVCEKTKGKPPTSMLSKTWRFGNRSLKVVLEKASWDKLLAYFEVPAGLTAQQAHRVRTTVTLAESRKDYRDRYLIYNTPQHRIATNRFREDGLLLPFGSLRQEFQEPNPTFFQTADTWPMMDNADPLHGWSSLEVADTSSGAATADLYGKLFYHLRAVLREFHARLSSTAVSFRLFQVDAAKLPVHLDGESFDRIETSNISDWAYLGIHRTVGLLAPLLRSPTVNSHATLITLSMNAVEETLTEGERLGGAKLSTEAKNRLRQYLPELRGPSVSPSLYASVIIKFIASLDIVGTYDHIFNRYMKVHKLDEFEMIAGAARKEEYTIVEKWPYRLKLRPGQPGAQAEFDRLLSSGVSGKECYLEWKRTIN